MNPVLRLELQSGDLLALTLSAPCMACARGGEFWLSVAGEDFCLESGQCARLPRGRLLVEGCGHLSLDVMEAPVRRWPHFGSGVLSW